MDFGFVSDSLSRALEMRQLEIELTQGEVGNRKSGHEIFLAQVLKGIDPKRSFLIPLHYSR